MQPYLHAMPIHTLYVNLAKKATSVSGTSSRILGASVSVVSNSMNIILGLAVPCAIYAFDSYLAHRANVVSFVVSLLGTWGFLASIITITP